MSTEARRRPQPAAARGPVAGRDPPHPRGHAGRHRARRRPLPVRARPGDLGRRRRDRRPRRPASSGRRATDRGARCGRAPPAYTLAARDPARDLPLDGEHVHLGHRRLRHRGPGPVDAGRSAAPRSRTWRDIARVADALDEIAFHWVAVSAQDRPPATRSLEELAAVWRNSTKHVQTESIVTPEEARDGDRDGRGDRRRPRRPPRRARRSR